MEPKSVEKKTVYFTRAGRANTKKTLRLAGEEAVARGLNKIILASTTGQTAREAAKHFAETGVKLIIVPH